VRADDVAPPAVVLDAVPTLARWPIRPVIAVADGAGGWLDATCGFAGFELTVGPPDDHYDLPAAHLVIALDNRDGRWSTYNPDGTPARFGPGTAVRLWAAPQSPGAGRWDEALWDEAVWGETGAVYWLFSGVISRADQAADDSVTWECHDVFSDLAQPVGTLTAGAAGDRPDARCTAILAAAGRSDVRTRFVPGAATLATAADDASPLDQLERAVSSDGGVIYTDADGTIRSADRHWRNGRTDQTSIWLVTDNACELAARAVIWDPTISTVDAGLADRIALENTGGLKAAAGTPTGRYVYTETEQLWRDQATGDQLAADLYADQRTARLSLDAATLHLFDPHQPELWQAVDWRLLDRLNFAHYQRAAGGGSTLIAVEVLIDSLQHAVTAGGGWQMTFGTTRATANRVTLNFWDTTTYTWDSPDPAAHWS
jgi:hypothetical protein